MGLEVSGIEKALQEGCNIHGFLSGGGLRVIRIEQEGNLRGYGEHPNVEGALRHANEDYLAGGKPYDSVYGASEPLYLTGSGRATSPLDRLLLRGQTIDAHMLGSDVVIELRGIAHINIPAEVTEQVKRTGQPVIWANRGYSYITSPSGLPNDPPYPPSTRVLTGPEGRDNADPWMYGVVKTGRGKGFLEALEHALEAEEVGVTR